MGARNSSAKPKPANIQPSVPPKQVLVHQNSPKKEEVSQKQETVKNQVLRKQIERILKGEIGPQNLTKQECVKMMHTIENRVNHPDLKSDIYSEKQYPSLQRPQEEYSLTSAQQEILDSAWNEKDVTPNAGKLGWDLNKNAIQSNKSYIWKPEESKTGTHYYYDAVKIEESGVGQ